MSLKWKFNIILLATSLIGIIISGLISFNLQRDNARKEALETAAILLESAVAVRSYTVDEVRPLIAEKSNTHFLAQTVPAFAASKYITNLQKQHPDYHYKEATLNPTNPANRAMDWEADVINYFQTSEQTTFVGERDTPTGRALYYSKPIRITNGKCLICHSTPEAAPPSMVKQYGTNNGFGWKLNEVIGAQIVSVPLALSHARADKEFILFMGTIILVFLTVAIILNILLNTFVLKPVALMASHVDKVSMGTLNLPPLKLSGKDEIASLGRSFNRMQSSLDSAVKLLDETLDD